MGAFPFFTGTIQPWLYERVQTFKDATSNNTFKLLNHLKSQDINIKSLRWFCKMGKSDESILHVGSLVPPLRGGKRREGRSHILLLQRRILPGFYLLNLVKSDMRITMGGEGRGYLRWLHLVQTGNKLVSISVSSIILIGRLLIWNHFPQKYGYKCSDLTFFEMGQIWSLVMGVSHFNQLGHQNNLVQLCTMLS